MAQAYGHPFQVSPFSEEQVCLVLAIKKLLQTVFLIK